jgi:hypothetical protein
LPSKWEAPSSKPSITHTKEREKRGRERGRKEGRNKRKKDLVYYFVLTAQIEGEPS